MGNSAIDKLLLDCELEQQVRGAEEAQIAALKKLQLMRERDLRIKALSKLISPADYEERERKEKSEQCRKEAMLISEDNIQRMFTVIDTPHRCGAITVDAL